MEQCSALIAIREMQMKTALRLHLTQAEWLTRKQIIIDAGKDMGKEEPLLTDDENVDLYGHYRNKYGGS